MIKIKVGLKCSIRHIKEENYDDCEFIFKNACMNYEITAVDGQYFQTRFDGPGHSKLDKTWWDSEGFCITERNTNK